MVPAGVDSYAPSFKAVGTTPSVFITIFKVYHAPVLNSTPVSGFPNLL